MSLKHIVPSRSKKGAARIGMELEQVNGETKTDMSDDEGRTHNAEQTHNEYYYNKGKMSSSGRVKATHDVFFGGVRQ